MTITAYVLIHAIHGRSVDVADALNGRTFDGARVLSVDTVTGPFDVIARFEADDLDHLAEAITQGTSGTSGVDDTLTCLSINLG